jgi:hypothetical protein
MHKLLYHPFIIKLFNWEYWPFHVVYVFIYPYWFWLCLKARSFFFFNASNPTIKNGGFLMESKKDIYDLIPQQFYPKTVFFNKETPIEEILQQVKQINLQFPLIGKPDIGMRGMGVQKLDTVDDVIIYTQQSKVNFLIQEFVPYENEVGIFYYRLPNEKKGKISGIVQKEFLSISGDGKSSIIKLLKKDKRYILQLPSLINAYGNKLQAVLPEGKEIILVPYGNHARGAKFVNISHLIDEQLTTTIDSICTQVKGFYYGRMDIRFNTWQELKAGKNFCIIEVNGAGSEPTHIYDPRHTIFFAWKEIIRHLKILYTISKINRQHANIPYMNFSSGLRMFRENYAYVKLLREKTK